MADRLTPAMKVFSQFYLEQAVKAAAAAGLERAAGATSLEETADGFRVQTDQAAAPMAGAFNYGFRHPLNLKGSNKYGRTPRRAYMGNMIKNVSLFRRAAAAYKDKAAEIIVSDSEYLRESDS